jgi:hypothetical protein
MWKSAELLFQNGVSLRIATNGDTLWIRGASILPIEVPLTNTARSDLEKAVQVTCDEVRSKGTQVKLLPFRGMNWDELTEDQRSAFQDALTSDAKIPDDVLDVIRGRPLESVGGHSEFVFDTLAFNRVWTELTRSDNDPDTR